MTYATELVQAGISGPQAVAFGGGVNTALASAGSTQATGTLVGASNIIVTGADGTKGVTLPAGLPGDDCVVFNSSASTLKVYPPAGAAIAVPGTGLGTANAAFSHLTFKTVLYRCVSSTQWLPIVTA